MTLAECQPGRRSSTKPRRPPGQCGGYPTRRRTALARIARSALRDRQVRREVAARPAGTDAASRDCRRPRQAAGRQFDPRAGIALNHSGRSAPTMRSSRDGLRRRVRRDPDLDAPPRLGVDERSEQLANRISFIVSVRFPPCRMCRQARANRIIPPPAVVSGRGLGQSAPVGLLGTPPTGCAHRGSARFSENRAGNTWARAP